MEAIAHNSAFAKKAGVPQRVGKDFAAADLKAGITKTHNGKPIKRADGGSVDDPNAIGGIAPTQATASPQVQDMMQRFAGMPAEQLQEAVIRMGPTSPMGALASRVLAQKRMMPTSQQQGFANPGQRGMPRAPTPAAQPNLQPGATAEQQTGQGLAKSLGQIMGNDTETPATQPQGFALGGMPMMSMSQADPPWSRGASRSMGAPMPTRGFLAGPTPGRADAIRGAPAVGSYVLPADIVSHFGSGSSLAGAHALSAAFSSGPYGTSIPHGGGRGPPRAPAPFHMTRGGATDTVPVELSDGEYVIPPEIVSQIGHGDVSRGHKVLDKFVEHTRKKLISTLKKLPGPVRS
jgi:hypothetical protein